ncbi:putative pentatricopeptide [Rosa chinensis]|uniref:Putative pentatricopeptide n=1 Tax=Rosa chinensis TaxID=74649 RepID=A0A2P6QPD8_ROSCH|nr:putative pentatricopeptide [Rosa chinensis]
MLENNTVSWTSLICGHGRRNMPKEAVFFVFEMVAAGIKPNLVTMVCVISACAKLKYASLSARVCAYIGEFGLKSNMLMVNSLVDDMYMKCGATDAAKQVFDDCVKKNLVLYNTILSNFVRQGLASEAVSIMGEMLRQGLRPDKVTMLSAISACAQLKCLSFWKVLPWLCSKEWTVRLG